MDHVSQIQVVSAWFWPLDSLNIHWRLCFDPSTPQLYKPEKKIYFIYFSFHFPNCPQNNYLITKNTISGDKIATKIRYKISNRVHQSSTNVEVFYLLMTLNYDARQKVTITKTTRKADFSNAIWHVRKLTLLSEVILRLHKINPIYLNRMNKSILKIIYPLV